jgi:hypothetical protein
MPDSSVTRPPVSTDDEDRVSRSRADADGRLGLLIDRYYWLQESRQQSVRRDGYVLAATLASTALYLAGPYVGVGTRSLAWFEALLLLCAGAYVLATLGRRLRTLDCSARAERELEAAGYAVTSGLVHDRRGLVVERPSGLALEFQSRLRTPRSKSEAV